MMLLPSISVIIPTLNEEAHPAEILTSLRGQPVHEVIVADGGSDDRTVELARLASVRVVDAPRGRARQMNAGAAVATGDVLLFLHADCRLGRAAVGRMRRILSRSGHAIGYFRQRIDGTHPLFRLIEFGSNLRARFLRRPYGDQAIFVRREVFHALGGFPDVQFLEDLYFVRAGRRFGPFLSMPEAVRSSPRRWERDGVIKRTVRNWSIALAEKRGEPVGELMRRYEADAASRGQAKLTFSPRKAARAKAGLHHECGPTRTKASSTAPGSS